MNRISIKIVGSSGQGIDSVGEIVAKSLKRSGYCVFGYREYPSLIKGGHASYQLDVSNEAIESTETHVNIVVTFNHHGLEINVPDLKPGGILIHSTPNWTFPKKEQELIDKLSLSIVELPIEATLNTLKAKPILANVLLTAFVWSILGQDIKALKKMVGEKFAKKKDLLELNMRCIDEGFALKAKNKDLLVTMPKPNKKWKDHLLITGSKAMGLGAVHAGVRFYAGYPMTPSSPLLSYMAAIQNQTGMAVKQAEDEITAAQMVSGAMHAGTRALTGTSGGGFDLMSETVSLNAIIENPSVFVLAQRPGPATGLPTWTGQGDLLMAVGTSHGEFARCVMSVSEADDSFSLMNDAFNIAEEYQISTIVLTDKQIAEALYTQAPYAPKDTVIKRGLVTDPAKLKKLKSSDRYDPTTKTGVSPRWLPGSEAATFVAQGDEHSADGTVDESAENAKAQIDKRMRKLDALKAGLPEPTLWRVESGKLKVEKESWTPDVLVVGWGSTKSVIIDVLRSIDGDLSLKAQVSKLTIGYLHYTYLWPLKTDRLEALMKTAKQTVLVEGNRLGQLGLLIRQQSGLNITTKILKYDGRPFFFDELLSDLQKVLPATR